MRIGFSYTWRTCNVKQNQKPTFFCLIVCHNRLPHSPTQTCSMPGLWSKSDCSLKRDFSALSWVSSLQGQGEEGKERSIKGYLSDVFLLLFFEGKFNEDLLQLLIAVVDNELLKAVVLSDKTYVCLLSCKHSGTQLESLAAAASQQAALLTAPSRFCDAMVWVILYWEWD